MTTGSRLLVAGLGAAFLAASLAGCTTGTSTPEPTPTSSASLTPGLTDIEDTPGSGANLEGALADNTMGSCERDGDEWVVSGTITNSTDKTADYRIYVSLLNSSNDTRALVQVDVDGVAVDASEDWDTSIPVAEDGLSCVLRVERYVA
jgi:hypothetical protein